MLEFSKKSQVNSKIKNIEKTWSNLKIWISKNKMGIFSNIGIFEKSQIIWKMKNLENNCSYLKVFKFEK